MTEASRAYVRAKSRKHKRDVVESVVDAGGFLFGLRREGRLVPVARAAREVHRVARRGGTEHEALRQGVRTEPVRTVDRHAGRLARRTAVGVATRYGDQIVQLVSETVRRWDARTLTDRVEGAVGRDLQFIRINGTLVGGLVGLTIHALDVYVI